MLKTMLIVDDNPLLTELFDELLNESFHVKIANSVAEALDELSHNNIDAMICDYHIGMQNAEVLIDWIRNQQPNLMSKFILITGETQLDLNLHKKVSSILYKPVAMEELLTTAERLFNQVQRIQG